MITSSALDFPGLTHGFFTRKGGVSSGIYEGLNVGLGSKDNRDSVLENRKRVANALGAEVDWLATPYQIHSPNVISLSAPLAEGADKNGDALVTNQPGLAIGVLTADCGPVLFADSHAGVVGAAHAGWKGAIGGVLENTVVAMEALGARREHISAVLGPTISQSAYEVGPEFYDRFSEQDSDWKRYFIASRTTDHHMFDLPAFIMDRLKKANIGNVCTLGLCTYADEKQFFSYRRKTHRKEPDYGRQISAIMLSGN